MEEFPPKKIERRGGARPGTGGPRPGSGRPRKVQPFVQRTEPIAADSPPLLRTPGAPIPKPLSPEEQQAIREKMTKFDPKTEGAMEFLRRVYRTDEVDLRQRIQAAQFVAREETRANAKTKGKKEERKDAADTLAQGGESGGGKFKTPEAPKLVANG